MPRTIIISEIAAMPIINIEVPLSGNIIAMLILVILEVLMSFFAFKSPKIRSLLYGRPSVFYQDGKLNQDEMLRQRFNVADIMEEIRSSGVCSLSEVEHIVMETNGNVSVILKSEYSPVTPKQLNIRSEAVRMSYIIIDNGTVIKSCMKRLGLNDEWLSSKLKEHGLKSASEVFYLGFEQGTGEIILIAKQKDKKRGRRN